MRKPIALVLTLALCAATAAHAAAGLPVPSLLRVASQLSGLRARSTPKVVELAPAALRKKAIALADRDYPPAAQAYDERLYRALGLLGPNEPLRRPLVAAQTAGVAGLYDAATRTVYVARGRSARATAVVELVHALQDQAFGVRKAFDVRTRGRDAAFAAAAANEGAAQLVTQVLPSAAVVRRTTQAAQTSTISRFLALEYGFAGATGLRFAANLNNVGGRAAVVDALRRLPTTTKQIFHLDAYLQRKQPLAVVLPVEPDGFTLVRDDTFGELDVRALLAIFQVPRLNLVGDGWGAGHSAHYRSAAGDAVALRLDWESELDARQWREAVDSYVNEAFDAAVPGAPAPTACAADACWELGSRRIAFTRAGIRTSLVFGPTVETAAALANSLLAARNEG